MTNILFLVYLWNGFWTGWACVFGMSNGSLWWLGWVLRSMGRLDCKNVSRTILNCLAQKFLCGFHCAVIKSLCRRTFSSENFSKRISKLLNRFLLKLSPKLIRKLKFISKIKISTIASAKIDTQLRILNPCRFSVLIFSTLGIDFCTHDKKFRICTDENKSYLFHQCELQN